MLCICFLICVVMLVEFEFMLHIAFVQFNVNMADIVVLRGL